MAKKVLELSEKEPRGIGPQKYNDMWRFEFIAWHKMVYDAVKSCVNEKGVIVFIRSGNNKVHEAELKIMKEFPKLKFTIEKEYDYMK